MCLFLMPVYIHMPPDNKDRSVSFLFETNNNGPYRWHIRITQIDCVRNSYSSAFSTFGNKINNYRLKKRSVDQGLMLNNFTQIQSELDTDGDHSGGRKKRSLFVTEASLRMAVSLPKLANLKFLLLTLNSFPNLNRNDDPCPARLPTVSHLGKRYPRKLQFRSLFQQFRLCHLH